MSRFPKGFFIRNLPDWAEDFCLRHAGHGVTFGAKRSDLTLTVDCFECGGRIVGPPTIGVSGEPLTRGNPL